MKGTENPVRSLNCYQLNLRCSRFMKLYRSSISCIQLALLKNRQQQVRFFTNLQYVSGWNLQ